MEPVQIVALVASLAITAVAVALFVKAIRSIIATLRLGQPAANRTNDPGARTLTMLRETLGHTRMLQWSKVGAAHWFIMLGFGLLFATLVNAYGQLFSATFILPVIGHFFLFEWVTEFFAWAMVIAIVPFMVYRATRPKERVRGEDGRFYGSTMWQGYFVEWVILTVGICILLLRFFEYAIASVLGETEQATAFHFPLTAWAGELFTGLSEPTLANLIWIVAATKIIISMVWMITLALNTTMGVAWHRFTAWFNIWFKRKADGGTSLGALQPMMSNGEPIDFENIDEMDEDTALGVGKVEDFSWKGLLDFTSCTECGRCQSQCPAWNTDKPLSPKLLITQLRDHAYAKAPYLLASQDGDGAVDTLPESTKAESERALVGATEGEWAWMPEGGAVIDDDVLWSCTSCGACVQQCPVDIEHVDHIVDMRRYQVLVESNFPAELNQLFKGLENKGNPWNMAASARLEWAKDLPFDVKVVGEDIQDLDEVEWLFWVGCAGAYEDRAKKTTRAVAELLDMADVSFGVLGSGETCTGDPARRAGNEFVFQGLATQNAEVLKETKAKKVVSTCAHCFNTLKNEYAAFGVELEVVHHTQLLNRLVREGRLTPVAGATNGANGATAGRSITYHDPCYLGRHNQVYAPPRELLDVIPNAELKEMPRNSERSFCCGAGGARMWMEEKVGERINLNRTNEAVETGADQIATGCPFCRVMLSDGLTAKQADGSAREDVEVLDVAQMLLASVKGETRAPAAAKAGADTAAVGAAAGAGGGTAVADPATKAEPESGDVTQTENTVTEASEVGAQQGSTSLFGDAATTNEQESASSAPTGGSLFDTPAEDAPSEAGATPKTDGEKPAGGSLFDTPAEEPTAAAPAEQSPAEQSPAAESTPASSGGSLFDVAPSEPEPAPAEPATSEPEPSSAEPSKAEAAAADTQSDASGGGLGEAGSLFDVAASEPEPDASTEPAPADDEASATEPEKPSASGEAGTTGGGVSEGGSLFDIAPAEPEAQAAPTDAAADADAEESAGATGAQDDAEDEDDVRDDQKAPPKSEGSIGEASSLFDL